MSDFVPGEGRANVAILAKVSKLGAMMVFIKTGFMSLCRSFEKGLEL